MDYTLVPGVLLSNRPIDAANPALTDIAPTIFAEFGIPQPGGMMGHSVFSRNSYRWRQRNVLAKDQDRRRIAGKG